LNNPDGKILHLRIKLTSM